MLRNDRIAMNHAVNFNEAGTELHLTKPGSPFIVSLSEVATAESLLALIKRLAGLDWISTQHIRELIEEAQLATITNSARVTIP